MVELLGKGNISDFFPWLAKFDVQGIARRAKQVLSVTEKILNSAIEKQMSEAAEQDGGLSLKHERKGFLQFLWSLMSMEMTQNRLLCNKSRPCLRYCILIFWFVVVGS
ncbi:hypothetical protein Prudu_014002 [Prunus dulcis]|uniref:Uncharacterized protein n=1 Tax=Prunus dulcis TaxID=3755 RepID=A0A4Y1RGA7_PRUDU|nr:hypothetical protein Prudu_014002 [Prunus dulcis]